MLINTYNFAFVLVEATNAEAMKLGAHYMQSSKLWRVPISKESVEQIMSMADNPERLAPLMLQLNRYRDWVNELKNGKTVTYQHPNLRPYQAVDVNFLRSIESAGIFNEQRTGKTPTALLSVGDNDDIIVVCPAGLKLNWAKEVKTWLGRESFVVSGTARKRAETYHLFADEYSSILIISYETLRADIEVINRLPKQGYTLIVDEAHRLRNYQTKQSKAVYSLNKYASNVYALTGTPAVNHSSDIYGILKLLNPIKWPSYWQFAERYYGVTDGMWGREVLGLRKDREEEFTNMLNEISVQRKRKDVMTWIPKVTRMTIPLELVGKQKTHYNKALKEFMYGDKEIPTVLAQLTRLRQICDDPALLELEGNSAKTDFILEYIDDNRDSSIIIFSSFTSYLKSLHTKLAGSVLLTGEQSSSEKQAAVDAIQTGTAKILLANIRAGGVGFTLDNADTIIFADRSYNPVDNDQASDRIIPTRADKEYGAKEIIDLVMENSIEVGINKLLDQKQNIISYVNSYIDNLLVNLGL